MKIFISYRRKDSAREVGRIRDRLKSIFGEQQVFRDLVDIPAGADFRAVLDAETNSCDVMLVVIGPAWAGITDDEGKKRLFNPEDFTRREVETGLNRLSSGKILVIPILVMNALMPSSVELPESLSKLTYQNAISIHDDPYFEFDMEQLIGAIERSEVYERLDQSIQSFEPQTIYIPAGQFLMGSPPGNGIPEYETPAHEINLPAYRIGRYPVTNAQYEAFISETHRMVPPIMGWDGQRFPDGLENYPASGVTWYEALAYCQWLSQKTGKKYSLPNEAQWEKACRGGNSFLYPWGNDLEPGRSNQGCANISAVDAYPAQNGYGCHDMVGNVRQWTCTLWGEKRLRPDAKYIYPWKDDLRNNINANPQIRRVVRGSSRKDERTLLRCSSRIGQVPDDPGLPGLRLGFRVVINI